MEIRMENKIFAGYSEDLSISYLYEQYNQLFSNCSMLITCLDSSRELVKLDKWISFVENQRIKYEKIGESFYFESAMVENLFLSKKTFYGFDEIYLFKNKKPSFSPDEQFTPEVVSFANKLPNKLVKIIQEINAEIFISDGIGCGLNIASTSPLDVYKINDVEKQCREFYKPYEI